MKKKIANHMTQIGNKILEEKIPDLLLYYKYIMSYIIIGTHYIKFYQKSTKRNTAVIIYFD